MRKFSILFFLILLSCNCFSQFEKNYFPVKITDTIPDDVYKIMKGRLESDKSKIKASAPSKEASKYKCDLYDDQNKDLVKMFNDDYFMVDSTFTLYLQTISDKIYAANPTLKKETRIFAYRSEVPNAFCSGEGTIAFNLGLLSRMKNEAQVAFIICHELAHYHMRHTEKYVDKLTDLNFDKDLKKEIDKIKRDEYNKYSKLKELLKDLTFDVTKHSRMSESEADSIGLSYFINTSYYPFDAIRSMEILDSCDLPAYTKIIDLKKYFGSEHYTFNEAWLEYDSLDFLYNPGEYAGSDTISTHPDCKKRVKYLLRQLNNNTKVKKDLKKSDDTEYRELLTRSEFETIETLYHFKDLGGALYQTLILLERYPENIYLHAMVGKCLYGIYYYQSIKEFGKVVALPDNRDSESYNRFLAFLHHLRLAEIGKISYYYMEKRAPKYSDDEEFLFALILNSKLPVSTLNKDSLINKYKEKFPKGKYIEHLNHF